MRPSLAPFSRTLLAPLAALALLCLLAPPSLASFAHGLQCTALGAATVSSSSDESSLHVSSIGPSSADGASMQLEGADGHRVGALFVWDSVQDLGAQISYEWISASGPSHTCTLTRTSGGMSIAGTLWEPVAGSAHEVGYYQGDFKVVVTTIMVAGDPTPSSGFEVTGLPSSSMVVAVDFERDGKTDLVMGSVSFPSLVTINGVQCDRVVVTFSEPTNSPLESCRLTCTNVPGGSFSSLDISSQSVVYQKTQLSSTGQLHFAYTPSSTPHLFECVLGPDGGGVSSSRAPLEKLHIENSTPLSEMHFPSGALVLTPGTDEGASLRCDVTGSSSCAPEAVVASLTTLVRSSDLLLSSHFSSMCVDAESVIVQRRGVVVARLAIAVDGSVVVTAPPGGPLGMAISTKGAPATKSKPNSKMTENLSGGPLEFPELVTSRDEITLQITLRDLRAFAVDGTVVVGDMVLFTGYRPSSGVPPMELTGTSFSFIPSRTGSYVPSTVVIQDITASGGDQVSAVTTSSAITLSSSTVQVPVVIDRTDDTPARGYSIAARIHGNVVIGSVVEGDYLSRSGATQMFVTDEGDGLYTIDCVILGAGCGPTDSGVLFTIPISAAPGAPDGTASVSIESVTLAGCDNDPLPCTTGGTAYVVIDRTPPAAPTAVTATQVTTGNPPGSTTEFTVRGHLEDRNSDSYEVYRAPYGNYPLYDDGPAAGVVPSPPTSYPPGAPWTLLTAPSSLSLCYSTNDLCWTDQSSSRDFYYFVVVARDSYGNSSSAPPMTGGTLNYHLGDNTDGLAQCTGDNRVDSADISALGALYGATPSPTTSVAFSCLDVGPTTDHRVSGRPLTDNKLTFQDLILAAINYHQVSAPADRAQPVAAATNYVHLLPAAIPPVGGTFDAVLAMSGAGDVQGLSVQLDYDPAVLELLSASSGELLARQGRGGVVLTESGNVDAALLGEGAGIAGEGELARVRFRVRAAGDAWLGVAGLDARDVQNREVPVGLLSSPTPPPSRTAIRYAYPDPFSRETRVEFTVPQRAPVKVGVFDVAGRHVRTLVNGTQEPGVQSVRWDGRDDTGTRRQPGVYMIRIESSGTRETRTVRLIP